MHVYGQQIFKLFSQLTLFTLSEELLRILLVISLIYKAKDEKLFPKTLDLKNCVASFDVRKIYRDFALAKDA